MRDKTFVYFEDQTAGRRRLYQNPLEIIEAWSADEVAHALERMATCQANGKYLAGYFAYELGYLLEETLRSRLPKTPNTPLLQFGVFEKFSDAELPIKNNGQKNGQINGLTPAWSFADYEKRFQHITSWIAAGDVYQVNLTFPIHGRYTGDAAAIYAAVKSAQPVKYGGVISLGGNGSKSRDEIVSLSPELFFEIDDGKISMRPMKGTARRGTTPKQDEILAQGLQRDTKNRAENLMIVDLLRNDLSRIATPGSVEVSDLYRLETYPTLHTMTSGIEARLGNISFKDILRALFPCGSVTGAPKIRAMEIIRDLELNVRGAYCGAVGLVDPDGSMRFNVGIRTLVLRQDGSCTYGVGSGVIADSDARAEYDECLLKAAFLQGGFGLIETLGWHESTGFMWLDLHLQRLKNSANELGFSFSKKDIIQALEVAIVDISGPQKVRLELHQNGNISVTSSPLPMSSPTALWPVTMGKNPLSSTDILLAHKTTRRQFVEGELHRLKNQTGCAEILLFNEHGEVCEGSYTNVFVEQNGKLLTPPLSSGLLPGILRQVMLANGDATEQVLYMDDVLGADALYIGNALRGLIKIKLTNKTRK